jgi:hypothetical protein
MVKNVVERLNYCIDKMRRVNIPGRKLEAWLEDDYHYTAEIATNDKKKNFKFDFIC